MALTDQLREILPEVLPSDPGKSLYGPELLKLVREKLKGDYADNTLRTTFSVLAADPTSPIARVEEGFGYYRRPSAQQSPPIADNSSLSTSDLGPLPDSNAKAFQLEERFRAFYLRHSGLLNRFPMHVEHLSAQRKSAGVNKWKFPDVLVLDWDAGESGDAGFVLDRSLLEVKRSLGEQPFRVTSVELKVELSLASFREHFFQCVSNSMWAHASCLVAALPVSDSLLATELRRLGASYGVNVQTFGFSRERLESLPNANDLSSMAESEFETLAKDISLTTISPGVPRPALDWEHIRDMKAQSKEFVDLFDWIARCLRDSRAYTFENYTKLRLIEDGAS